MDASEKILSREALLDRLGRRRRGGGTVALANGLFDLLHVGHLRYLEAAALEADVLVVAVNSDASARLLRGPSRPVVPAAERAELIAGLSCVDFVTIFEETTVEPLIRAVRPDVHCKGTDYNAGNVPELTVAREMGIRIAIVGDPKDHNATDIIRRIRALPEP